ncbi:MAG: RNA polymerase sigma factor [Ruminococcus sp.]|nr:RNA polymerase sigma factor [Ruminococcus sp.]
MAADKTFDRLYESTKQSVLIYIAARCRSITDIEDIYQETYLRAYDALRQRRELRDPEAFVMGIAKHCVSHYYSVLQRMKLRIQPAPREETSELPDLADDEDLEELVADRLLYEELYNDICTRPPTVQRMFYLHYLLELPLSQTAEALGLTEGQVRQQLYKTVRELRRKYGRRDAE